MAVLESLNLEKVILKILSDLSCDILIDNQSRGEHVLKICECDYYLLDDIIIWYVEKLPFFYKNYFSLDWKGQESSK